MVDLLPDPGDALAEFLRAQPEIAAVVSGRVSVRLESDAPSIRYANIGGTAWTDEAEPTVQVECWGAGGVGYDDGTASQTARTVLAVLPRMTGVYAGGHIATAVPDAHPFDSPDPVTDRPRVIVTVRLLTYPAT